MRLIDANHFLGTGNVLFREFPEYELPEYAILSHRWGEGEVTLQELSNPHIFAQNNTGSKKGFVKLWNAAVKTIDWRCKWLWCDTCCIDKTSSTELSEAINSMFRWYKNSHLCLAYLSDIPTTDVAHFTRSEWFERAWTLQELIAPEHLVFFDSSWKEMQTKQFLIDDIVQRTRIDKAVLIEGERQLDRFTVAQKMSWAAGRKATRIEDITYSLLGIFDVNMPMLYGEGTRAFVRLQEEIIRRNADQSIFVWDSSTITRSLFASSPMQFANCANMRLQKMKRKAFTVNNLGLEIELMIRPIGLNAYVAYLPVEDGGPEYLASLVLEIDSESGYYSRAGSSVRLSDETTNLQVQQTQKLTILRTISPGSQQLPPSLFGFYLEAENVNLSLVNNWDPDHHWDKGRWSTDGRRNLYSFIIPEDASASIAMVRLHLPRNTFLIQLTFDFEFNPCVQVSKITLKEIARRRKSADREDELFGWAEAKVDWENHIRFEDYQSTEGKRFWVAKSKERLEFKTSIPPRIIHSVIPVDISFSCEGEHSKAWHFKITSNSGLVPQGQQGEVQIGDYQSDHEMEMDSDMEGPQRAATTFFENPTPWPHPSEAQAEAEAEAHPRPHPHPHLDKSKIRRGMFGGAFGMSRTDTSPT